MLIELLVAAVVLVTIGFVVVLGAPPVSSSAKERAAVVELLKPLQPTAITDLGAGWGAMALTLARAFPDARVTAYELSPLPWLVARIRCAGKARIVFGDFRNVTHEGVLVSYLARAPMHDVAKLLKGHVLVTVCFFLRDRTPTLVLNGVALYR